jgi:hypothetical protein
MTHAKVAVLHTVEPRIAPFEFHAPLAVLQSLRRGHIIRNPGCQFLEMAPEHPRDRESQPRPV